MKMNFLLSYTTSQAMIRGLTDALYLAEQDLNNSVIVITPETKTVMAERFLLEKSKNGAFSNIYIGSYNRLLSKLSICHESYLLSRETGIYIIKKLIQELSSSLICYKKASNFLGFAESIYDTITQIKSSGITPEEFSSVARASKGALPSKMADIALIYDAYENYLGDKFLDMCDSLDEIAKFSKNSEFIKNAHIFVLGFESVTKQMDEVIASFVKTAKSVTVSAAFIHPGLKNAHITDNEVFSHYKGVADRLRIEYNPVYIYQNFSKDMSHIVDNAFVYPAKSIKSNGDIKFYQANNIQEEITFVAEEISSSIRQGARFRDFGILLANLEDYEYEFKRIFDEYNIPCFISKQYDLSKHTFFVMLVHILEIARIGLESSHMIALSKCPLLSLSGNPNDFENYIYRTGGNFNNFVNSFVTDENSKYIEQEKQAEEMRISLLNMLSKITEKIKGASKVKQFVSAIKEFIEEYNLEQKLEDLSNEQSLLGEKEMSAVTEQVLSKTLSSLQVLEDILGESNISVQEFSGLLLSGLSSIEISLIPLELDSVIVQSRTDGMKNVQKLYVLGASEGKFPVCSEDCGIIRDDEINSLSDMFKVKIEPTIRTINRRERYKAFETVIGFKAVNISYSKTNDKLEQCSPSSMLTTLAYLFEDYIVGGEVVFKKVNTSLNSKAFFPDFIFTQRNLERQFCNIVGQVKGGIRDFDAGKLASLQKPINNSNIDFNKLLIDKEDEPVLQDSSIFFKNNKTSISQLEKYFTCPFLHFANYGLGLKDRQEAKLQRIDVGNLLHKIAEEYVKIYIKNNTVSQEEINSIISNVLLSNENAIKNNRILINILEKESIRLLEALKEQLLSSEFKPTEVETWFGVNSKYKAIDLGDNIRIEGKIDRIDVNGEYYKVVDYKTGKIEETPEGVYYGKKVQLLSYIQSVGSTGLKPAGALYFPIRNEWQTTKKKALDSYKNKGYLLKDEEVLKKMDISLCSGNNSKFLPVKFIKGKSKNKDENYREFGAEGNLLTSSQFEGITDYITKLEKQAVKEIKEGYIAPSPLILNKNSNPCMYCDYKYVCKLHKQENNQGRVALTDIEFNKFV